MFGLKSLQRSSNSHLLWMDTQAFLLHLYFLIQLLQKLAALHHNKLEALSCKMIFNIECQLLLKESFYEWLSELKSYFDNIYGPKDNRGQRIDSVDHCSH